MRPMLSLLFVPGHRETWPAKAVAGGADGVILDLEDSVPAAMKEEARQKVASSIRALASGSRKVGVYVRLNAMETGIAGDDIERVTIEGLDGYVLPKTYGARGIVQFDALVSHFERRNGVKPGTVEFILALETAQAYAACERMLAAPPRVATLFAGTAKVRMSRAQSGSSSRRRAWKRCICGVARSSPRALQASNFRSWASGRTSTTRRVHAAFPGRTASSAFAAILYEGHHIDYAHVKTARQVLALHKTLTQKAG